MKLFYKEGKEESAKDNGATPTTTEAQPAESAEPPSNEKQDMETEGGEEAPATPADTNHTPSENTVQEEQ